MDEVLCYICTYEPSEERQKLDFLYNSVLLLNTPKNTRVYSLQDLSAIYHLDMDLKISAFRRVPNILLKRFAQHHAYIHDAEKSERKRKIAKLSSSSTTTSAGAPRTSSYSLE
ncbi:hypothetical protein ElyMa_005027400 [Elysia marginata]|uniref:RAWUL domain-containing protein n=1 Tax=Elysia marginata TaxID=1093978 RepID=A0AAV4JA21_9GAST|nr:hypothetical protein ElyMa_005027400 [Elysia marginata]